MSGGADGADLVWGAEARRHGHKVLHFSFAGHRTQAPLDELIILSDDDLRRADPYLAKASARLKRRWPPASQYAANLLRRDWYQVKDAERVYAVARLQDNRQIEGGTAWTVTLFIDRHDGRPCEAYLFEPNRRQWFRWNTGRAASSPASCMAASRRSMSALRREVPTETGRSAPWPVPLQMGAGHRPPLASLISKSKASSFLTLLTRVLIR